MLFTAHQSDAFAAQHRDAQARSTKKHAHKNVLLRLCLMSPGAARMSPSFHRFGAIFSHSPRHCSIRPDDNAEAFVCRHTFSFTPLP
jgi:hypothetical protein